MGLYTRNAVYRHKQLEWTKTGDVEDNDFKLIVDRIINARQSLVINGKDRCGKSTLINMMQQEMTEQGILFISLALTNKACRLINGTTLP